MSTEITYFLKIPAQHESPQPQAISLTNLGNGQSMNFNSLDKAISFLDKAYPPNRDNGATPRSGRKGVSG